MTILDIVGLSCSVALPWIAGTLWVRALPGFADRLGISVGYGYLVGMFGVTAAMRLLSAIGVSWSVTSIALPAAALAAGAYLWARPRTTTRWRWHGAGALAMLPREHRALFCFLLLLTVAKAIPLLLDVLWTPLVPFDAWAQWASKARVWYEYGRMMPFVDGEEWLKSGTSAQFTDIHAGYPGTVPLFQVWTALCIGRWDESLVNLPWAACYIALGIASYAQLRRLGFSPIKSMFGTYLLLSLPFLTVHVALAGMADIFVASAYGLAAIAFWQWTLGRRASDAALALVMAIVCASVKVEGSLWVATLVPGVLVALHRRLGLATTAVAAVAAVVFLAAAPPDLILFGYTLPGFENVSLPLYQHLLLMDNWHLLGYAAIAIIAMNYRFLLGKALAPMTVTMLSAAAFVIVVFFFSDASRGVENESLINRLTLQLVPALVFYLALILRERTNSRSSQHQQKTAALYT